MALDLFLSSINVVVGRTLILIFFRVLIKLPFDEPLVVKCDSEEYFEIGLL
jgi:hypothetical protein